MISHSNLLVRINQAKILENKNIRQTIPNNMHANRIINGFCIVVQTSENQTYTKIDNKVNDGQTMQVRPAK